MTIQGLHHMQFTVPPADVDKAREFYCGLLGLPEIEKPDVLKSSGGFWLKLGNLDIHISVQAAVERSLLSNHPAFLVDDLAAWREQLTDYGLIIKESIQFAGYVRFETRDPFGNRLEFIQAIT